MRNAGGLISSAGVCGAGDCWFARKYQIVGVGRVISSIKSEHMHACCLR